jgi:hypothetical protein
MKLQIIRLIFFEIFQNLIQLSKNNNYQNTIIIQLIAARFLRIYLIINLTVSKVYIHIVTFEFLLRNYCLKSNII